MQYHLPSSVLANTLTAFSLREFVGKTLHPPLDMPNEKVSKRHNK